MVFRTFPPVFHIIYISHAVAPMSPAVLVALLEKFRAFNHSAGITGALFYHDGYFLQVIEGEEAAIRRLYAKIQKDQLHRTVTTLFEEPIREREFSKWSMAFRNLDLDASGAPEGFEEIFNMELSQIELKRYPSKVRAFLAEMCGL
ncbi:MAG: BLUF domain-containing protein [Akkermansiaceae bacterium]|nr:BLUF domain-containing protein [Akkermansiaceae bacterium]